MPATMKKYDLDLSKIEDEQLVVLVQECGYRPAANELVLRYHPLMGRSRRDRLFVPHAKPQHNFVPRLEAVEERPLLAVDNSSDGIGTFQDDPSGGMSPRSVNEIVDSMLPHRAHGLHSASIVCSSKTPLLNPAKFFRLFPTKFFWFLGYQIDGQRKYIFRGL